MAGTSMETRPVAGRVRCRAMPPRRVLLLGEGDLNEETAEALRASEAEVERLEDPTQERGPQRPGVVAGHDQRRVGTLAERLAQLLVRRILQPHDLGVGRAQRLRGLLVQVAFAKQ